MKLILIIIQVLVIYFFLLLGTAIKNITFLPIPAPMIGLILLFLGLKFKVIKLHWVEKGGSWLLAELLLFFVPSAVGIVNYNEILNWKGMEMILLIGLSTIIVMGATGFVAEKIYNWRRGGTV